MMIILLILLVVVVILLAIGLIKHLVKGSGPALKVHFKRMGTLRGKTYLDVVKGCGKPVSTELATDRAGRKIKICSWTDHGYGITLLFDHRDICLGVSSEDEQ